MSQVYVDDYDSKIIKDPERRLSIYVGDIEYTFRSISTAVKWIQKQSRKGGLLDSIPKT